MRLSLSVNGSTRVIASLAVPGYLSAHLNMHDRPNESDYSKKVRVVGIDTSVETENVSLNWPEIDLEVNDVVELRVLEEGTGDAPTEIRRSSEAPSNLFSSVELARDLLRLVSDFETRLMLLLSKSEAEEPADESKKLRNAVGHVVYELGNRLLYPIFRRHKELIPEKLKGELF
jgi:hypothetical protein